MTETEILVQRLKAPFQWNELELRAGATKPGQAKPLAYVDTRAVTQRLSRVLGVGNYNVKEPKLYMAEDTYEKTEWNKELRKKESLGEKTGLLVGCSISIEVNHPALKMTVSNVGEKSLDESGYNKCTSAFAQAFKRAASQLGIGEYIYNFDLDYVSYNPNDKFGNYVIPDDVMEEALKRAGFEGICEITGEKVPWKWSARGMRYYGRVLCEEEQKKLHELEKGQKK